MHPRLQVKLNEKAAKYAKVTTFAKLLPMFENEILNDEHTADKYCQLSMRYKTVYLAWGINWTLHKPTNFPDARSFDEKGLVNVYLNCMSLFPEDLYHFAQKRLYEAMKDVPAYFVDELNSTWYFKPEEVELGLEVINEWFVKTAELGTEHLKQKKRERLQAELEKLNA
jgi:hypothetical protein